MRRLEKIVMGCAIGFWFACVAPVQSGGTTDVRNVIVMIPDGCAGTLPTVARWIKGAPLALDGIVRGLVRTAAGNAVITDSAAAATAIATGHKTDNGCIGVVPEEGGTGTNAPRKRYRPVATVAEAARAKGKAIGLVVTCTVSHATPAAFVAHCDSRGAEATIIEQMVNQDLDVVFGGGLSLLLPVEAGGSRRDGKDLLGGLTNRGYRVIQKRDELAALDATKVWGLFASNALAVAVDAPAFGIDQPSLAEMTAKAIELLSRSTNGFFLVIEGSQIDWGSHAADPVYTLTEFQAFDEAAKVALDFAKGAGKDQTLLIACPDHCTGGWSLGNDAVRKFPAPDEFPKILQGKRVTVAGLCQKIGPTSTPERVKAALDEWWGMDLPDDECQQLVDAAQQRQGSMNKAIVQTLVPRCFGMGWTTRGHTGDDVILWAYGPGAPCGLVDNTDIARCIAAAIGVDLNSLPVEDPREAPPETVK